MEGDRARAAAAGLAAAFVVASTSPRTAAAQTDEPVEDPPTRDAIIGGTPVGSTRVLDGDVPVPEEWASVVALVGPGDGVAIDRQFCGGTVVAPRWVLTAAHCLYGIRAMLEPADVRVVAGVSDLGAGPVDERDVVNLYVHPSYDHDATNAYDDIALIELAYPLDVAAVSLFGGDVDALGDARGIVVGWGATAFIDPRRAIYPDVLQHAVVPLVSRDTCNDPLSYDGHVGDGQLCAGFAAGGVDSCVGDSGGPLFVDTGPRVEQVGIVSYGRDCAQPLFYGIYSSVPAYRSWVGEYVELEPSPVDASDVPGEGDATVGEDSVGSVGPEGDGGDERSTDRGGATGAIGLLVLGVFAVLGRCSGSSRTARARGAPR